MQLYNILRFKKFSDARGLLVPLEFGADFPNHNIPFAVKRCFFIFPEYQGIRAQHAHDRLEEVLICLTGSFDLILKDGKGKKETVCMNDCTQGVHIYPRIWLEMTNFSKDCLVLALANEHYIPEDNIREYSTFLSMIQE